MNIQQLQPVGLFATKDLSSIHNWVEAFSKGVSSPIDGLTLAYVMWNSVTEYYNKQLENYHDVEEEQNRHFREFLASEGYTPADIINISLNQPVDYGHNMEAKN